MNHFHLPRFYFSFQAIQHLSDRDFASAHTLLTQALSADNSDAVLWSNRSACCLAMDMMDEALSDAEHAIKLRPNWPKVKIPSSLQSFKFLIFHEISLNRFSIKSLIQSLNVLLSGILSSRYSTSSNGSNF